MSDSMLLPESGVCHRKGGTPEGVVSILEWLDEVRAEMWAKEVDNPSPYTTLDYQIIAIDQGVVYYRWYWKSKPTLRTVLG